MGPHGLVVLSRTGYTLCDSGVIYVNKWLLRGTRPIRWIFYAEVKANIHHKTP